MALACCRTSIRVLPALALALLAPGARAVPMTPPSITIMAMGLDIVGGVASTTVPLTQGSSELEWVLASDRQWSQPGAFSLMLCSNGSGSGMCGSAPPGIGTMFDQDPFISYRGGVQDVGLPTSFSFIFSQGIVPTPTPGVANHHQSNSTTDGGDGDVPITAGPAPAAVDPFSDDDPDQDGDGEIYVFSLSTNGGTSFLNAGLDLRPDFTAGPQSETQAGLDETGPGPAGSGLYDFMRVDVNFSMEGGNDIITFNGKATIVPEPATAALLALGLLGLTALGRRRT